MLTDGEAVEAPSAGDAPADAPQGERERGRGRTEGEGDERPRRRGRRRRVCIMCAEHMKTVDYKDIGFLRRYVSDRARIETRRKSSSCAKHQRAVARDIKRARHLALIPYTPAHIRLSGFGR
jgi:small subunit ribosomal protein S18